MTSFSLRNLWINNKNLSKIIAYIETFAPSTNIHEDWRGYAELFFLHYSRGKPPAMNLCSWILHFLMHGNQKGAPVSLIHTWTVDFGPWPNLGFHKGKSFLVWPLMLSQGEPNHVFIFFPMAMADFFLAKGAMAQWAPLIHQCTWSRM